MDEALPLSLVFVPGLWTVTLVTGDVLEIRADGFSKSDDVYTFSVVTHGNPKPHKEFHVACVPVGVVVDVEGGPVS